jgi:hypothetical protein
MDMTSEKSCIYLVSESFPEYCRKAGGFSEEQELFCKVQLNVHKISDLNISSTISRVRDNMQIVTRDLEF